MREISVLSLRGVLFSPERRGELFILHSAMRNK